MRLALAVTMHIGHIRPLITIETLRLRRQVLGRFCDHIGGDVAIRAVRAPHIQGWVNAQQVSAATVHLRYGIVHGFFLDAIRHHWIAADPTLDIRLPRRPRKQPRAFTTAELAALESVLPDARARLILALAVNEGLRRIEICRLELDDLDLAYRTVRIVTAKSGNEDVIPLTDDTHDRHLIPYLGERGRGAGPLIRSYTSDGPLNPGYLGAMVTRWCKEAGIKAAPYDGKSLHAGRHTRAMTLYDDGAPPEIIQFAMRHSTLGTTLDQYIRPRTKLDDLRKWVGSQAAG